MRFYVNFECEIALDIDERVMEVITDDWRSHFYNINTWEDLAAFIGYNMFINKLKLSQIDGLCDLDDGLATIMEEGDWFQRAEKLVVPGGDVGTL